ncbi:glycine zipper 2TM domain-containing protein [Sphingosinicella rhizophila]|uniref:17 kDa surface antigen n=1 Tax=Sphingosinicella rhizophila TaxID=3050082 RepID=A0ABU3Q404_9SPHN|nr:glycine zipper 2TM domain-containing protein [Sphingosinicella sp. GR2756]MDT9598145.1 glycine zipper 2TM domain-containing protein [Sphingosinicella sp. GR2756]
MRTPILAAAALAIMPLSACTTNDGYYADDWGRQYRPGTYEPYAMSRDDYIYRGDDGRYYCKRRDGTVGLVIGAGVGGLLGNLIAPRGSKTIGTIIGAAGGAVAGRAIERGEVRCQ